MKTTKILASAFIFFALSVNSFAMDTSDNLSNTIKKNANDIASILIKSGRNNNLRTTQDNLALQFTANQSNNVLFTAIMPKGRNLEVIDSNKENSPSFATSAKSGRNNKMLNELISMN
ncbi:hypothetical protein [uncultured Cocleimonas sp.]|uniref:hypothetical protein n=1 Tax=uncultured Cocleimonas sp. TaxID=1051587 RepID=UPI0026149530|nr:hypothetical protein [uncultured Cocleimonas sp.]